MLFLYFIFMNTKLNPKMCFSGAEHMDNRKGACMWALDLVKSCDQGPATDMLNPHFLFQRLDINCPTHMTTYKMWGCLLWGPKVSSQGRLQPQVLADPNHCSESSFIASFRRLSSGNRWLRVDGSPATHGFPLNHPFFPYIHTCSKLWWID